MVGGSLMAVMVRRKELLVAAPSASVTTRVMVTVPLALGNGVTLTLRSEPLPPNAMLALGTTDGSEEKPARPRLAAGVSGSLMVKSMGASVESSLMVRLEMACMVGAKLPRM